MTWSVYINKEFVKKIELKEFPKFNWRYKIDGKHYKLNSIGWTNHKLNMYEVSEWEVVHMEAPVIDYTCEECGYVKLK